MPDGIPLPVNGVESKTRILVSCPKIGDNEAKIQQELATNLTPAFVP